METSVRFRVLNQSVAIFIGLPAVLFILISVKRKVIVVNKVIPCVIRWVDINHFHFTGICLPKHFQHVEVIALNVKVPCMVEVHTFFPTWAQRFSGRHISQMCMNLLVRPCELIAFFALVYHVGRQFVTQFLEVNAQHRLAILIFVFRYALRKQPRNLVYV